MTFGEALTTWWMARRTMGVSGLHDRLTAGGIDVSRATVYAWLDGTRTPSAATLVRLLEVLDVERGERETWIRAAGYGPIVDALAPRGDS